MIIVRARALTAEVPVLFCGATDKKEAFCREDDLIRWFHSI
jgi:hypothetical protein